MTPPARRLPGVGRITVEPVWPRAYRRAGRAGGYEPGAGTGQSPRPFLGPDLRHTAVRRVLAAESGRAEQDGQPGRATGRLRRLCALLFAPGAAAERYYQECFGFHPSPVSRARRLRAAKLAMAHPLPDAGKQTNVAEQIEAVADDAGHAHLGQLVRTVSVVHRPGEDADPPLVELAH